MCVPAAVVAGAGLGLQVLGTLQGAQAARQQSAANKAGFEFQAAVEDNKATVAEYQARDAIERGKQGQFQQQLKTAQLKGAQRARFAAAGLDLEEGSAFNVLMDTDFLGKLDESTISDNAEREAYTLRESARAGRSNADFLYQRAASENPGKAGLTSLLGGAGQVASSWYKLNSKGG